LVAIAENDESPVDFSKWHALQTWLASAEHRVTIPYAPTLANTIPPIAVRLRRDFSSVLNLIRAHAILHQETRHRDSQGRITATFADYRIVRELVSDLVAEGIDAGVPRTIKETVQAVKNMGPMGDKPLSVSDIAASLNLDRSAALRRVRACLDRGYLRNLEDRDKRPLKIVMGEPLPKEHEILPSEEALRIEHFKEYENQTGSPGPDEAHVYNEEEFEE
jgi:hypothetical protein